MRHLRGRVKRRLNGRVLKTGSLHKPKGCVPLISAKRLSIAFLRVIQNRVFSTNWILSPHQLGSCILKFASSTEKAYVIHEELGTASPLRDDSRVFIINSIQPEFAPYQRSRDASLLNQCRVPIHYLGSVHQFLRNLRSRFHCILTGSWAASIDLCPFMKAASPLLKNTNLRLRTTPFCP